jgi:hypothetical protein
VLDVPKGHQPDRVNLLSELRDWLRTTIYMDIPTNRGGDSDDELRSPSTINQTNSVLVNTLIKATAALSVSTSSNSSASSGSTAATSLSGHSGGPESNPSADAKKSILDPENPSPLNAEAKKALKHFGKSAEYEKILAQRTEEARYLADRQQKRLK